MTWIGRRLGARCRDDRACTVLLLSSPLCLASLESRALHCLSGTVEAPLLARRSRDGAEPAGPPRDESCCGEEEARDASAPVCCVRAAACVVL